MGDGSGVADGVTSGASVAVGDGSDVAGAIVSKLGAVGVGSPGCSAVAVGDGVASALWPVCEMDRGVGVGDSAEDASVQATIADDSNSADNINASRPTARRRNRDKLKLFTE